MAITKEQELLGTIISKAWEEKEFKELLVSDPVSAIEQVTGKKLSIPEGKRIVVRDQTDESTIYINIPAKQEMDDVELSEEQLDVVSGGGGIKLSIDIWGEIKKIF